MSDKAWFHLSGYLNSQNSRYWSAHNPRQIFEVPQHDRKIGVWCAITSHRIIGPIFFTDTVNSQRYIEDIITPFTEKLTDYEWQYAYFQQDGATAHTANASLKAVHDVFGDDRTV